LDSASRFEVMDASTRALGSVNSPEGWGAGQSTKFDLWLMHSLIYAWDCNYHPFCYGAHILFDYRGLISNLQNMILMQNRQRGILFWQWFPQSPHGFFVCRSDVMFPS
jgi:hypothetical protein